MCVSEAFMSNATFTNHHTHVFLLVAVLDVPQQGQRRGLEDGDGDALEVHDVGHLRDGSPCTARTAYSYNGGTLVEVKIKVV